MSFLTTTATLHHETTLPPPITFARALSILQDHDRLLRLDPELASYEELPRPPATAGVPADQSPKTKSYTVTDHMHALPAGLWDTTVTFECNLTNTEDGVEWVIRAPLGMLQKTVWQLVKRGGENGQEQEQEHKHDAICEGGKDEMNGDGGWTLVEDVEIRGNRFVVGVVKKKCEENWEAIHRRYMSYLVTEEE